MREVTPKALRCTYMAACPALYEQEDGVLVIGKVLETVPAELLDKVGPDETVVWVPKGLLRNIEWKD